MVNLYVTCMFGLSPLCRLRAFHNSISNRGSDMFRPWGFGGSSGGLGGWGWGGVMHAAHLNSTKQYRCGIMDNFWTGIVLVCCFNLKGLNQSIPIYLSYSILSTYMMCVCMVCVVVVCPFREAQAQKHATCARLEIETWLVLDWAQCVERSGPKVSINQIDGWCIQPDEDHLPSGYLP